MFPINARTTKLELLLAEARQKMKELAETVREIEYQKWLMRQNINKLDEIGTN